MKSLNLDQFQTFQHERGRSSKGPCLCRSFNVLSKRKPHGVREGRSASVVYCLAGDVALCADVLLTLSTGSWHGMLWNNEASSYLIYIHSV